jgi:hypothetical protein
MFKLLENGLGRGRVWISSSRFFAQGAVLALRLWWRRVALVRLAPPFLSAVLLGLVARFEPGGVAKNLLPVAGSRHEAIGRFVLPAPNRSIGDFKQLH